MHILLNSYSLSYCSFATLCFQYFFAYLLSYFYYILVFCFSGCQIPREGAKARPLLAKRKRGEASMSIIDLMHDASLREKAFTPQEKVDQLLPANDSVKFTNRYCELKYPVFATSRNLYLERTLKIPRKRLVLPGEKPDRGQCILG